METDWAHLWCPHGLPLASFFARIPRENAPVRNCMRDTGGALSRGIRAKKLQREALAHAGNGNESNPLGKRESVEIRVPQCDLPFLRQFEG